MLHPPDCSTPDYFEIQRTDKAGFVLRTLTPEAREWSEKFLAEPLPNGLASSAVPSSRRSLRRRSSAVVSCGSCDEHLRCHADDLITFRCRNGDRDQPGMQDGAAG